MSTRPLLLAVSLAMACSHHFSSNSGQGDALVLLVDANGTATLNGREMSSADLLGLKRSETDADLESIILQVQSGSSMGSLTTLLSTLIGKARKGNVAILIETATGRHIVQLPVVRALPYLQVTTGKLVYEESRLSVEEQRHFWLGARVGPSGACRIETLEHRRFDEVDFSGPPQNWKKWEGAHPEFGLWSEIQLRGFLSEPRIQKLSPFLDLEVRPGDLINDFLDCLQLLHRIAPGRVLVSIPAQ